MSLVIITITQILVLVFISFGTLIGGDNVASCFTGLYAIPFVLMLIKFAPDLMRGEHE